MANIVAQNIAFYGYVSTFAFGYIGHACSLMTFSAKTLRHTSIGLLFIFLTLSDAIYLFMCIYDFIVRIVQLPIRPSDYLCRFRTFTVDFATVTSSWLLVLIALNRLIGARFPYQQAKVCTPKVTACAVAIVFMCSTLFACHVLQAAFIYNNLSVNLCGPTRSPPTSYSIFYYNTWPILQLIISYIIPSCLMILCLIGIHFKVRVQRILTSASVRKERLQRQVLILMISRVACFAICTLPYAIDRIFFQKLGNTSTNNLVLSILIFFLNINYSYNFYIHCLTSKLFRQTFIQQFKRFLLLCKRQTNNIVYPLPAISG